LSKLFKKFDKNSPTAVDAKVGLPNIEVQELRGSAAAPDACSKFLTQTSQLKVNFSPVKTPRTYVGRDAQLLFLRLDYSEVNNHLHDPVI
jgi:hypothetical protein